ncbi:MAG: chemotaxis protein CheW [Syntrophomonadaceae bacterium]
MINILKLRKIEKEKKLQENGDSPEQNFDELTSEKSAPKEQIIEDIDKQIIAEITEEINNAPDSPLEDFRNPSEVLLDMSQDIEEVEGSVEIQEFRSTVEHDATEETADPWITEYKDNPLKNESPDGAAEELINESMAEKEEFKEPEIDPAEAFRQALIAEVLRDESMLTRSQIEEEEKMSKPSAEAPQTKVTESKTAGEKPSALSLPAESAKQEEKKLEVNKPAVGQPQDAIVQDAKVQDTKQHESIIQLVGFNLGKECYGVDIKRIKEINRMTEITRVPRAPGFIEGVINLRGSVIPVINLRKKVKMPPREYDKDTRIIIVELAGKTIGFIVDAVKEVLRIPESLLVPPPTLAVGKNADYITSVAKVEDELVILLDPDKVLSREETEKLEETDGKKKK